MAWCLEALAGASTAKGQPNTGAKFLGAAEALREAVGAPIKPAEQSAYQRHLNDTRAAFSTPDEFRDSWGEGRNLTASELVDMAAVLQDNDGPMSG
jgi:hypothetical protein